MTPRFATLIGLVLMIGCARAGAPAVQPPIPAARVTEPLTFPEEAGCLAARDYLQRTLGGLVIVDPDTMTDWRTQRIVPACRVYAAGASRVDMVVAARAFYDQLLAAGWTRTPDPRDMPNEAAIRLRMNGFDCLYHVYRAPLIGTASELAVINAVRLEPGENRYDILVQCIPAAEAAPL